MTEMEDFGDVGAIQQTGDGAAYWDAALSDILEELETINIQTAHIQNATLSADRPRRFASGTPVFIEQFEYGSVLWHLDSSGSDGSSERSQTRYVSKGYAIELMSATDSTHRAYMQLKLGPLRLGPLGLQFSFTFANYSDYYRVEWYLVTATVRYDPEIIIDYNNSRIQILDANDAWQTVLEWDSISSGGGNFWSIKVTLDTLTGMWDTLFFDSEEVDLSAHGLPSGTAEAHGYFWIEVDHYGENARNPKVYVDDVCITEEE